MAYGGEKQKSGPPIYADALTLLQTSSFFSWGLLMSSSARRGIFGFSPFIHSDVHPCFA